MKYGALLKVVNEIEIFSGFCYTQLTDTFQEANGLLYADRTPKFPLEAIRSATLGRGGEEELEVILPSPVKAERPQEKDVFPGAAKA